MIMLSRFEGHAKTMNVPLVPFLRALKSGCTDGGNNERAAFRSVAKEAEKLKNALLGEGMRDFSPEDIILLVCSEHALASK